MQRKDAVQSAEGLLVLRTKVVLHAGNSRGKYRVVVIDRFLKMMDHRRAPNLVFWTICEV